MATMTAKHQHLQRGVLAKTTPGEKDHERFRVIAGMAASVVGVEYSNMHASAMLCQEFHHSAFSCRIAATDYAPLFLQIC